MASIDSIEIASQEKGAKRLRILVLASFCDPEAVSMPYVAYCHAAALGKLHDVSLVIGAPVEEKVLRARGPFYSIEVIRRPLLERFHAWVFRNVFNSDFSSQALTAFGYPFWVQFELQAWRQLRQRIFAGEFDLVLRLLPMSAVVPSPFAFLLRNGPIPFVIGPISGGLPFVKGFKQAENQREWISGLRRLYPYFPFARSTYQSAAAIIAASSHTYAEFARYSEKLFSVPEPGISRALCLENQRGTDSREPLDLVFVGGLVPCKACDLALRAAAPLISNGSARLAILGGGPEQGKLEQLAGSLGIAEGVVFHGWVNHAEVLRRLRAADMLVFPSVRDFGAGAVYEALACGAVPLVADFGGPGDVVYPDVGFKVSLTNEDEVVAQMSRILQDVAGNRQQLVPLRKQGMVYARERLTWEAKADATTQVLNWVLQRGPKPNLLPQKYSGKKAVLLYEGDVQTEMPVTGDR